MNAALASSLASSLAVIGVFVVMGLGALVVKWSERGVNRAVARALASEDDCTLIVRDHRDTEPGVQR